MESHLILTLTLTLTESLALALNLALTHQAVLDLRAALLHLLPHERALLLDGQRLACRRRLGLRHRQLGCGQGDRRQSAAAAAWNLRAVPASA